MKTTKKKPGRPKKAVKKDIKVPAIDGAKWDEYEMKMKGLKVVKISIPLKQPRNHKDVDFGQTLWGLSLDSGRASKTLYVGKVLQLKSDCLVLYFNNTKEDCSGFEYSQCYFTAEDAAQAAIEMLNAPQEKEPQFLGGAIATITNHDKYATV